MGGTENYRNEEPASVRHIYVHIPFCHHICPYCSFYKHKPGALANGAFVDALLADLRNRLQSIPVAPETIYFGGGTPTLLSTSLLSRLLDGFAESLDLSGLREWNIEANPATFGPAKARAMARRGITRVSLGVQSWNADTLRTLGRDHSPAEAETAYYVLRKAEIPSVNLDLMFSIPGEEKVSWQQTLEKTIDLAPDHISSYNLNYEEDTPFFERLQTGEFSMDEDTDATFFQTAITGLEAAGYHHYEISNYARPGSESQHNKAYWNGADYLGIGPGAVSTVAGQRWTNRADTAAYVDAIQSGAPIETESESLTTDQRRTEAIALQLRTSEGLDKRWLGEAFYPEQPDAAKRPVETLLKENLVAWRNDRLVLTKQGKPLVDSIATYLL